MKDVIKNTMKAVVCTKYGGPEVLEIQNVAAPVPEDNQVLVKIHAAVVGATDPVFRTGEPWISRLFTGFTRPKYSVPGDVFAGTIEKVGKDVTLFKTGDRVYGATSISSGAHAEYICIPEKGAIGLKPENMNFGEAAAVCDGGLTALPFLRDEAKLKKGDKILINGASGAVGSFAVQLARYYGAEVTAVCSSKNSDMVRSLGAARVIDYTKEDFTQKTGEYDVIFDAVGKSSFRACKKALAEGGIYLTTVPAFSTMIATIFNKKSTKKRGRFAATGLREAEDKSKDLVFLKHLIEAGEATVFIDREYSMEDIAQAHSYVEKGHKRGNVILAVAQ